MGTIEDWLKGNGYGDEDMQWYRMFMYCNRTGVFFTGFMGLDAKEKIRRMDILQEYLAWKTREDRVVRSVEDEKVDLSLGSRSEDTGGIAPVVRCDAGARLMVYKGGGF